MSLELCPHRDRESLTVGSDLIVHQLLCLNDVAVRLIRRFPDSHLQADIFNSVTTKIMEHKKWTVWPKQVELSQDHPLITTITKAQIAQHWREHKRFRPKFHGETLQHRECQEMSGDSDCMEAETEGFVLEFWPALLCRLAECRKSQATTDAIYLVDRILYGVDFATHGTQGLIQVGNPAGWTKSRAHRARRTLQRLIIEMVKNQFSSLSETLPAALMQLARKVNLTEVPTNGNQARKAGR